MQLKVGILLGGMSVEKEVSFNSGRTVYDHIDKNRYEPIILFQKSDGTLYELPQKFLYRGKISDFEHRLEKEAKKLTWSSLKNVIDLVFIAMHGRYAEDGVLQGMLEILKIPYVGTKIFGSALSRDKFLMYDALQQAGISVPNHIKIMYSKETGMPSIHDDEKIEFPCVVKPHKEGSSIGVSVARTAPELHDALMKAATCSGGMQSVLVEKKIEGKEFVCSVITDPKTGALVPLTPTEIEIDHGCDIFDYDQKYMPGRATKYTPARFSTEAIKKIQDIAVRAVQALSLHNCMRIDGFLTEEKIIIIDVNTIVGMAPSSFFFCQAAHQGMNHADVINTLIEAELKYYGK